MKMIRHWSEVSQVGGSTGGACNARGSVSHGINKESIGLTDGQGGGRKGGGKGRGEALYSRGGK